MSIAPQIVVGFILACVFLFLAFALRSSRAGDRAQTPAVALNAFSFMQAFAIVAIILLVVAVVVAMPK